MPVTEKKRPRGRPRHPEGQAQVPALSFRPSQEIRDFLIDFAEREKRTVSNLIGYIVETWLEEQGLWPEKKGK